MKARNRGKQQQRRLERECAEKLMELNAREIWRLYWKRYFQERRLALKRKR